MRSANSYEIQELSSLAAFIAAGVVAHGNDDVAGVADRSVKIAQAIRMRTAAEYPPEPEPAEQSEVGRPLAAESRPPAPRGDQGVVGQSAGDPPAPPLEPPPLDPAPVEEPA